MLVIQQTFHAAHPVHAASDYLVLVASDDHALAHSVLKAFGSLAYEDFRLIYNGM